MNDASKTLDLETVRAFVLIADLGSFTRAAEVMETSQAAISLKLKRLEDRLGCRLIERTPRHVRLSDQGNRFLPAARDLMTAHETALSGIGAAPRRKLTLGISDHVAGPELPLLLSRLSAYDPAVVIEVRIASSRYLMERFDHNEFDAVIIRRGEGRMDGEKLLAEQFCWFAAPSFRYRPGESLRLATLAAPCGIRAVAIDALEQAGIPWTEAFVGGGVLALGAAVNAGLAVAALARRVAPAGALDVGERFGLPPLPTLDIVLLSRQTDQRSREILKVLAAAFKGAAGR
ncbi:LysR family transcriptional regulator [Phyllobacterium salinisoli]|uniref:LysR family transcriptional regulator n=1 Tax=Phyllobacterium salinisoli TaxID=1899321 RepID=A0A368K566_9HYPH|nr:LysR family transcriptional regulator [Phyllobacterium salinisoli]RCS23623.1 LysR family transcriptional regulator [Phyllobacterium salinisoli]